MTVRILEGDCRDVLRTLPDESVHCCVTSPPYFGLRDYGTGEWLGGDPACTHAPTSGGQGQSGQRADRAFTGESPQRNSCSRCGAQRHDRQMGLEETPEDFVAGMVAVFREVRRVLRADGTLWLNIGDSYAGSLGAQGHGPSNTSALARHAVNNHPKKASQTGSIRAAGVKAKDLYGIPWMLAFALRADGWYLRQDIIWSKPNPMPESIKDRCTKAHEYLFLLSKSARYYYDAAAITEPASANTHARIAQDVANQLGSARGHGGEKKNGNMKAVARTNGVGWGYADGEEAKPRTMKPVSGWDTGPGSHRKLEGRYNGVGQKGKANAAGSRQNESFSAAISGEVVLKRNKRSVWTIPTAPFKEAHFATFPPALVEPCIRAGCPIGGVVLDPFGGAGTTGMVADRLQREAILIELNPEYSAIARRRISGDSPLFAEVAHA